MTSGRWSSCAVVTAVAFATACYSTSVIGDAPIDSSPARMDYAAIVRADNPVGYWRLGDRDRTAVDSSGSGTPGTYGDGITQGVPGAIVDTTDSAAEFDGRSGVISLGSGFDFPLAFSIEAWIKPTVLDEQFRHVFTRQIRTPPQPRQGYALLVNGAKGVIFERFVDDIPFTAEYSIVANSFSHIVATYDGAYMRLYVNGHEERSSTASGEQLATPEALTLIGAATLTQGFFAGAIDEVAVYSTALSAEHIAMHYRAGTMP